MSSLLMQIHSIHDCLKIICDVESDVFDSSLRGLFRRKNYAGNEQTLSVALQKLEQVVALIRSMRFGSEGVKAVASDAVNYSDALMASTKQLLKINNALWQKSSGHPYSMSSYNSDCNSFRQLQDRYCTFGDRLNADYKLYALEISKLP